MKNSSISSNWPTYIFTIAVLLALVLLFTACNYEESVQTKLTGTWTFKKALENKQDKTALYAGYTITFTEDQIQMQGTDAVPNETADFPRLSSYRVEGPRDIRIEYVKSSAVWANHYSIDMEIRKSTSTSLELQAEDDTFHLHLSRQ